MSLAFWRTGGGGGSGQHTCRLSESTAGLTIRALVLAVVVDVLELFERLDNVQVLAVEAGRAVGRRRSQALGSEETLSGETAVDVPEVVYDVF